MTSVLSPPRGAKSPTTVAAIGSAGETYVRMSEKAGLAVKSKGGGNLQARLKQVQAKMALKKAEENGEKTATATGVMPNGQTIEISVAESKSVRKGEVIVLPSDVDSHK